MPYEKVGKNEPVCIADEVPFEIPASWEWVRLSKIVYNRGQMEPANDFCYIDIGSIDNKHQKLSDEENIIAIDKAPSRARKIVDIGDILYSTVRPYLHNMCIVDRPFSHQPIASTGFAALTCHTGFYNEFLFYYLMSPDFDAYVNDTDNAKGVAYPAINDNKLYQALIPVPPEAEQKKIVEKIKKVLPYVDTYRTSYSESESLNNAFPNRLKKSILQEAVQGKLVPQDSNDEPASVLLERIRAEKEELIKQGKIKRDKKESIIFKGEDNSYYENISNNTICIDEEVPFDLPDGWIWCRLKSLADPHENSFVDGPFGSNLKTDHYTDRREVRIIQLNNIGEFTWKNNGIKYTTYSHAETLSRCKSYPGDIVIAKMMPAGRAIIIPDIEDVYVISSDCVRLQLPNYIDKRYVMYMINSPTINKSVMKNVQGIGRTRTSLSKLKELLVPIPPYKQQCQISATFDKSLFYFDTINALCE